MEAEALKAVFECECGFEFEDEVEVARTPGERKEPAAWVG